MGILVKTMNKGGFTSFEVAAFRSFVTGILMLAGMALFNRPALKIRRKDLWCFVGTGIVSVSFFNVCYFSCMGFTTLSTAAILLYTAPSIVMVLSFFLFKEKFTAKKILAVVMAFAGCVLVSGGLSGLQISTAGLLTGLGAGLGYALYSIFGRYAIERGYNSFTITTYTFLFSSVGFLPILNWKQFAGTLSENAQMLPFTVFMTVVVTILPYLFYTKGLSGMENGMASILASVEPVMASVVGLLIYKEEISAVGLAGMALVLGSCVLVGLKEKN